MRDVMENGNFQDLPSTPLKHYKKKQKINKQAYSFVLNNIFLLVPIFLQFIDTFLYARKTEPLQEYSLCNVHFVGNLLHSRDRQPEESHESCEQSKA